MSTLLLCGPMPKPVGGISIHISRLMGMLESLGYQAEVCDESGVTKEEYFNLRSANLIRYIKLVWRCDLVHIHSSVHMFRFWHILWAVVFRKPMIVTLHSWRNSGMTTAFWRLVLRLVKARMIFVSDAIKRDINLDGIVAPAFIRPNMTDEPELPPSVEQWMECRRAEGDKIVVSNAYKLDWYNDQDLYGLDICVEAFSELLKHKVAASMLFVIADHEPGSGYIDLIEQRIHELGIEENFRIYRGILSFAKLLSESDASIRATNTDGDSLSVRESIGLGCITVASDCVYRPEGTRLFKNRDHLNLCSVLQKELSSDTVSSTRSQMIDCVPEITAVYKRLLGVRF